MFVICHLFPENRDEVPEKFRNDGMFVSVRDRAFGLRPLRRDTMADQAADEADLAH